MAVTKLIQVTNISPAITEDQMLTLFGFLGKIEAMCMYPSLQRLEVAPDTPRICYIKFFDSACVGISQYLTNTVFNDRALVVSPVEDGQIPNEEKAKQMAASVGLPSSVSKLPNQPKSEIVNLLEGSPPKQVIVSYDPRLEEFGLPKYPPLPASYEGQVIEEIRRTVLIIDINVDVSSDELIKFFEKAGDIKYLKFCSRSDNIRYALIEFTEQSHVIQALKMNGQTLRGNAMKVYHSTQAITKPETKSNEVAQREVVEALTRVKEAESLILAAIDPGKSKRGRSRSKSPRKSRSSRAKRRSRSKSSHRRRGSPKSRRSRSRSHHRKPRSKSPKRPRKSRSKSPSRTQRKSHSKSPRTSRSRSLPRRQRQSRSRSPRAKRKSRFEKRENETKSPSRSKRRSRSKSARKSRSPHSKRTNRSSSKLETAPQKSSSSRDKARKPDKSQNVKKNQHEDRDRDRKDSNRDLKNGHSRSKRSDPKSKKDFNDKESGINSSQIGPLTDLSLPDKSSLVKEIDALEFSEKVGVESDHLLKETSNLNQTDFPDGESLEENNFSVLNNDTMSECLDCMEEGHVFHSVKNCDSLSFDARPETNVDKCSTVVEELEESRSRSNI